MSTTKQKFPKPNRPGWRFLEPGEIVRKTDRYQFGSDLGDKNAPHRDTRVTKVDVGGDSGGPDLFPVSGRWGGYTRKIAKKRGTPAKRAKKGSRK